MLVVAIWHEMREDIVEKIARKRWRERDDGIPGFWSRQYQTTDNRKPMETPVNDGRRDIVVPEKTISTLLHVNDSER